MTDDRVRDACKLYFEKLANFGPATKLPDLGFPRDKDECMRHVRWMALETSKFVDEGKREKAMRWLGWMQAALTIHGIYPISDTMRHNMPVDDPRQFDANA
jgi:hypothetical protein